MAASCKGELATTLPSIQTEQVGMPSTVGLPMNDEMMSGRLFGAFNVREDFSDEALAIHVNAHSRRSESPGNWIGRLPASMRRKAPHG